MTAEEYLARAADRVEKGWCQASNFQVKPDGTIDYCLIGALGGWQEGLATEGGMQAYDAVKQELGLQSLIVWNDTVCTSGIEAATTLRNAKRWL